MFHRTVQIYLRTIPVLFFINLRHEKWAAGQTNASLPSHTLSLLVLLIITEVQHSAIWFISLSPYSWIFTQFWCFLSPQIIWITMLTSHFVCFFEFDFLLCWVHKYPCEMNMISRIMLSSCSHGFHQSPLSAALLTSPFAPNQRESLYQGKYNSSTTY